MARYLLNFHYRGKLTSGNAVKQIGMIPGKKRAKRVTLTSANVVKQATGPGKKKNAKN